MQLIPWLNVGLMFYIASSTLFLFSIKQSVNFKAMNENTVFVLFSALCSNFQNNIKVR